MVMLGCDPEFTIFDEKGRPVPAHSVGINDKTDPHLFHPSYYTGDKLTKFFRDGFNLEVNIYPTTCRALATEAINQVLRRAAQKLPPGYTIGTKAAFEVALDALQDAPEDVKRFGCNPSLDAYSGNQKIVDLDAESHPFRYAGGHLHFGTLRTHGSSGISKKELRPKVIKLFDRLIGVPLAVLFTGPEQWQRRQYYGQAGEYRFQEYDKHNIGLEYRTPGPEMFNHPALVSLFMGVGRYALGNPGLYDTLAAQTPDDVIQHAINTGEGASALLTTVPQFYTPEVIKKLAKMKKVLNTFVMDSFTWDGHRGWYEFAGEWGLSNGNKQEVAYFS